MRPVRLRLTWRQRRAFALTVVGYQVLVWADALLNDGRFGGGPGTAVAGAVFLVMVWAMWWLGTSATKRGLVVHAVLPMTIPWDEVREIEVQTQLGRKVVVVHHGTDLPRRTRLAAPVSGPIATDDEFHDKVRVLRSYWAAHRSGDQAA
jgi:hypothetical protein